MEKEKAYKDKNTINNSMLPSDPSGSLDESFSNTLVFIDEGFISKLSKYFGKGKYLRFNKSIFAKNLSNKEKLFCEKIFYYTSPPFQSMSPTKDEELRKEGHDKFIERLRKEKIIVREGRCQRLKIDGEYKYGQKAVDILITMDLMSVPIKYPKIKRIILISSDSDFVPVIENLEENGVKTVLYTYYEKKRNTNFSRSNHLIKSVYKYKLFCKEDFDDAKLNKEEKK